MEKQEIRDKLKKVRHFFLDMDGTFFLGDKVIPGSLEFLEACERTGRTAHFLTNNSSKTTAASVNRLRNAGVPEKYFDIITAGHAAAHYCLRKFPGKKCYLLGNPDLHKEMTDMGLEIVEDGADYVLVGFDTTMTYEKMCKVCTYLWSGKPYIATHQDYNCPMENGYVPDIGAILGYIEAATTLKPHHIIGKPHSGIVTEIVMRTGYTLEYCAVVGDRIYTDVETATRHGMTGILVLSGDATMYDVQASAVKPDLIFRNLGDMIEYLD